MEKKFQRRTVLVKKTLQLKYIGIVFVSVVLATLIVGGDIFFSMYRILLRDNPSLAPLLHQVHSMILVKLILYLGIIFLVSLFVSHRFAGPIYRFEKSAQAVSGGDLTHRVSLRTGDELLELQEEFNGMVASLQSLVQKDRAAVSRLAQRLEAAIKSLPDEGRGADAVREELRALKAELQRLTSSFKV